MYSFLAHKGEEFVSTPPHRVLTNCKGGQDALSTPDDRGQSGYPTRYNTDQGQISGRPAMYRQTPFRYLGIFTAAALAVAVVAEYGRWRNHLQRLETTAAVYQLHDRNPQLLEDLRREPDSNRTSLRLARAILADELDPSWRRELNPDELQQWQAQRGEKLATAYRLAEGAFAHRPGSWQAAMTLGGTLYLDRTTRRITPGSRAGQPWLPFLRRTRELGPGQIEPVRLLAAVLLSDWSRFSEAERSEAKEVLRQALADTKSFDLLAERWLRVAPSLEAALELFPDKTRTWTKMENVYRAREDWERFAQARRKRREALSIELAERLVLAERLLTDREIEKARHQLLAVLRDAPTEVAHVPAFQQALTRLPPGPVGPSFRPPMQRWFRWTVERCLRVQCPFQAATIQRLAGLARLQEPHDMAAAALLSGDRVRARRYESEQPAVGAEEWGPYRLLKARDSFNRGNNEVARQEVELVPVRWRSTGAYLNLLRMFGETESLQEHYGESIGRTTWSADGGTLRKEFTSRPGSCYELRLLFDQVRPSGVVAEIYLDDVLQTVQPITRGRSVTIRLPTGDSLPATHTITIDGIAGRPGEPSSRLVRCSSVADQRSDRSGGTETQKRNRVARK